MRTQRRVFEKLSESTKVELASEKIELSVVSDFDSAFAAGFKFMQQAEKELKEVKKTYLAAQGEFKNVIDAYNKYEKIAKELGVSIPNEYISKNKDVISYLKEIKSKL